MNVVQPRTRSVSLFIDNGKLSGNRMDPLSSTCHRCGNATSPRNAIAVSLQKVSVHNRSLAGTPRNGSILDLGGHPGTSSLELEAFAAVHELSHAVQSMSISEMLPRTPDMIFVNLTTNAGQPYCLELTHKGWRITSLRTDCMVGDFTRLELFTKYYDSPYELLDTILPGYRTQFDEKLVSKLKLIENGDKLFVVPLDSYDSSCHNPFLHRRRNSTLSDDSSLSDRTRGTTPLSEMDELDHETLFN
ncbi:GSK3-beta interaction protein [Trichostrongylus colubriformis]|uniref:GSK3-beta interaction protein n=1 Tax=Trichostrongylus colubriformis TaxID=6319 RepID=A0AAN8FHE2_TRICO